MSPTIRRELLVAALRGAACSPLLLWAAPPRVFPAATLVYAALLVVPASLTEGWLLRRARARWWWVPVAWLVALAVVGLAQLQAVYATGVLAAGLAGGEAAIQAERARLVGSPSSDVPRWLAYLGIAAAAAVALGSAPIARPIQARLGTLSPSVLFAWALVAIAMLLLATASCTVVMVVLWGEGGLAVAGGALFVLGAGAGALLLGLAPIWLLTGLLRRPEAPPTAPDPGRQAAAA